MTQNINSVNEKNNLISWAPLVQSLLMKKTLLLVLTLASAMVAKAERADVIAENWFDTWLDHTTSIAQEFCNNWRHELPETGMLPSFVTAEFTSSMGERHGGSSLSWQELGINLPLADPRRSGGQDWMFNASFNAEVTFLDADGAFHLKRNRVYQLSLPLSVIVPRENGNMLVLAVSPSLSSDFVHSAHSFHFNMLGSYRIKHSESFSYSVGLAYAPTAGNWSVMPVVTFDWQMSSDWSLHLSGYRLAAMRDMGQGLEAGLFVQTAGGSWAVDTQVGTRLLRVRSLVVGATAEYDFSKPEETKRIVALSLGCTLATAADICHYDSDRKRLESHHYHPGLFVSASVDFRF